VGFIINFIKKNNLDNNYTQGVVKLARETFKANYHSSSSCGTSDAHRTFLALQFVHPMRQKSLNLYRGRVYLWTLLGFEEPA
jgi:hypothetical protein